MENPFELINERLQKIEELRSQGIPCYYTMDAGPNVKVICEKQNVAFIIDELSKASTAGRRRCSALCCRNAAQQIQLAEYL